MKSQIHEDQKNIIFVSKKMIFSAIALTAFSFAGMANEVKEKEVHINKEKTIKNNILLPNFTYCDWIGIIEYINLLNAGVPQTVANQISLGKREICYAE